MGHQRICISSLWEGSGVALPDGVELVHAAMDESDTYQQGEILAEEWLSKNEQDRFTALLASDQFCYGFLKVLNSIDTSLCPGKISVMSVVEMKMNEFVFPSLTALSCDPFEYGRTSAGILIEMLKEKTPFEKLVERAKEFYSAECKIIKRDSVGPVPK